MPLVNEAAIVQRMDTKIDPSVAEALVKEFISLEKRYVLRDWEPAELDGGQFCEILARIIYHQDSGNLNLTKAFDDCIKYIENDQVAHHFPSRQGAIHFSKVLRAIYKFRSQRGAVHITPSYSANEMDARLIAESVRWCFSEFLRLYWNADRNRVAGAIREISQFDVPAVGRFEDLVMVQRTDLDPDEEILVLLHHAGDQGLSRRDIGRFALLNAPAVTRAIQKLCSPDSRQVIALPSGNYRLTDLGAKRIREELAESLNL